MSLENEVALVTGATRGIGKAIAIALGGRGAAIIGTATSEKGSETIDNYMKEKGINGFGMTLNVNDPSTIDSVLKEIADKTGAAPSILINNAGITRDNLLMRMSEDEWDAIMETNLKSVYRMTKACLRPMVKARKGRVISVGSVVGAIGNAGQVNYAAAKAGIMGFSKSLAREVASRNITVNVVAPGFVDTDMTKALPDEQRQALAASIPLARLGQPEDIANAVVFLASGEAAYITGLTLHVNGGMYMN